MKLYLFFVCRGFWGYNGLVKLVGNGGFCPKLTRRLTQKLPCNCSCMTKYSAYLFTQYNLIIDKITQRGYNELKWVMMLVMNNALFN